MWRSWGDVSEEVQPVRVVIFNDGALLCSPPGCAPPEEDSFSLTLRRVVSRPEAEQQVRRDCRCL